MFNRETHKLVGSFIYLSRLRFICHVVTDLVLKIIHFDIRAAEYFGIIPFLYLISTMKLHLSTFILLPILFLKSSAIVRRRNYQDQTSWDFHQPTVRYEKAKFDKTLVKNLASIKIDKADDVRLKS